MRRRPGSRPFAAFRRTTRALLAAAALAGAAPLLAQGTGVELVNFEAPAHKPIVVVRVGTTDYLLVANPPDNSVEVYHTAGPSFLFRVPTGQRPVTIAVRPSTTDVGGRQVYVANWLGDSITVFDLEPIASSPGLRFRLLTTEPVGDEPVGIAFLPENPNDPATLPGGALHELVLVTFSSRAAWGVFLPATLAPVLPSIELMQNDPTSPVVNVAVKDPRAIAFAPPPAAGGTYSDQLWILNFRGGNDPAVYDLDLWGSNNVVASAGSGFANLPRRAGLGTTNFQMSFAANGDLWVVGTRARNKDPLLVPDPINATGEPVHQQMVLAQTGFVVSFLARYRNLATATPQLDLLDLNDARQGVPPIQQATLPVTQPTDVAIYGDGTPGRTRVFATGFDSDTLAMVQPQVGGVATWGVTRIDVKAPVNAFSQANLGGVMRGPRGLALKAGPLPGPGDRLYVYNRLDSSVTVVDPTTSPPTVLANFPLQGQPEPAHVLAGRKFLYSSKLSGSGPGVGGNVSCASCHIDGNTDFLAWNLSDGNPIPAPGSPNALPGGLGPNPGLKGQMVTQPLRGLVNFQVAGQLVQDTFFSNRPYHWRGDKGFVDQFNAAYVNLMGMPNINPGAPTPAFNKGIPDPQMTQYRDFVFSVHYPPNPNQDWHRVYSGALGNLNDAVTGSGALLGLKAFHIQPSDLVSLACVHCHTLPEGSNNLLTEAIANNNPIATIPAQALETAQLKALVLKEKRLQRVVGGSFVSLPAGGPQAVTHEFGLTHTGQSDGIPGFGSLSLNDFLAGFNLGAANPALPDAMALFMRELDSGVGPLVGFTATTDVPRFNANPAAQTTALTGFEDQVRKANCGLAVQARIAGVLRGFWLAVSDLATPYHEEPQAGIPPLNLSQSGLLDFVRNGSPVVSPDNLLTFHFTPLGSSRRVAHLQGGLAPALAGGTPTGVTLLPARPMTANAAVPTLTVNWADLITGFTFLNPVNSATVPQQISVVHYQKSLVNWAPGGFGLTQLRHETPRRLRVAGSGIVNDAFLLLWPPSAVDVATATTTTPPTTVPTPANNPWLLALPIFPAFDGVSVTWETAAELEPLYLLALMNGGPANPQAVTAFFTPLATQWFGGPTGYRLDGTDLIQPALWSWYFVQVANKTATGLQISTGSWQRLTVQ